MTQKLVLLWPASEVAWHCSVYWKQGTKSSPHAGGWKLVSTFWSEYQSTCEYVFKPPTGLILGQVFTHFHQLWPEAGSYYNMAVSSQSCGNGENFVESRTAQRRKGSFPPIPERKSQGMILIGSACITWPSQEPSIPVVVRGRVWR